MRTVIIIDQFSGPTPYSLQQNPMRWADLRKQVEEDPERFRFGFTQPVIREVEENFYPQMATTVYAEGENGEVIVWKHRWDSSG